jgi:quinol monooxygenase YgiN
MITVVAKLKVQAGKEEVAEREFRDMIQYVRANEPGTLQYVMYRSRSDRAQFVVYEVYKDQAALDAHSTSPRMMALFGALGGVLDGQPSIEMLEEVDGKH